MRLVVALLALLLAGCAAPDSPNPLLGQCPQWVPEPGGAHPGAYDGGSGTQVVRPQNLTYLGRPFDLLRLKVESLSGNGTLELRAYAVANGTRGAQRTWRDFRGDAPQLVPYLVVDGAAVGHEFEATLTSIAAGDEAAPGPIELAWTSTNGGAAHVTYTLAYQYKVCGV